MSTILNAIMKGEDEFEIKKLIKSGHSLIPLFEKQKILKNKSLYEHFNRYTKLKNWTLEDFVRVKAIDLTSINEDAHDLLELSILQQRIDRIKLLLRYGVKLIQEDYNLAKDKPNVKDFFDYRPGSEQPTIFSVCSARKGKYPHEKIIAILADYANTSSSDSSEAEELSAEELSDSEEDEYYIFQAKELKKFNKVRKSSDAIRLVAARGVHFTPTFFSAETRENIKKNKAQSYPTYSASTLYDAGYDADSEVGEEDKRIKKQHERNVKFISNLKKTDDHMEKAIKGKPAPKTRNDQEFENLYYRFMQVYINSYSRLFNEGSIKIDFNFYSRHNPLVSASWDFEKAGMYGSGLRMGWDKRRDPHYRRFTGKPKHPNMGYIDIYSFDPNYVRKNGFDRLLMCGDGYIKLSSFYRHEQEVVFTSMIPKEFHVYRAIITLPSFENKFLTKITSACYGIRNNNEYEAMQERVTDLPAQKSKGYKHFVDIVTEDAVKAQTSIIKKTVTVRLFREASSKVEAYDHGNKYEAFPFKL